MNSILADYLKNAADLLETVAATQSEALSRGAELIAHAFETGHGIYVFGCTHSAIMAEDVFYRAGAPAFWRPLWGPGMSIATTPGILTSAIEHSEDAGNAVIECSRLGKDDVLVVLSTSGKNAAPVAAALRALKRNVKLIAITSSAYRDEKGNHSTVPNLSALAETEQCLLIDNHVPLGDASIEVAGCPMGPLSTIAGSFLMHALSALAVEILAKKGVVPPVFKSSNAPGGLEHNRKLMLLPGVAEAFTLP